ncbi:hypothetical protein AB1Y20_014453 [Prymnesium parvum]|uniref:TNase-like domain-containing protein n=1 Tax=Prymnesium parvum TaxID=97485 RepID=A0AB34IDQ7_PRYPA
MALLLCAAAALPSPSPALSAAAALLAVGAGRTAALLRAHPLPSSAASFSAGFAVGLLASPALREFPTAADVPSTLFARHKTITARVVKVTDGDTYRAAHLPPLAWARKRRGGKRKLSESTLQLRVAAVDCPETAKFGQAGQRYGAEAAEFARRELQGRVVKVKLLQRDQYGRAVCTVRYGWWGGRKDISEELLRRGLAVVYRQGGGQYDGPIERWARLEAQAMERKVGMWKEGGVDPAAYKRKLREEKGPKSSGFEPVDLVASDAMEIGHPEDPPPRHQRPPRRPAPRRSPPHHLPPLLSCPSSASCPSKLSTGLLLLGFGISLFFWGGNEPPPPPFPPVSSAAALSAADLTPPHPPPLASPRLASPPPPHHSPPPLPPPPPRLPPPLPLPSLTVAPPSAAPCPPPPPQPQPLRPPKPRPPAPPGIPPPPAFPPQTPASVCLHSIRMKGLHWENTVVDNVAGVWGGTCTCPDGQEYFVGDNADFCESLACEEQGPWSTRRSKVDCATAPPASLTLTVESKAALEEGSPAWREVLESYSVESGEQGSPSSIAWEGQLCVPRAISTKVQFCFDVGIDSSPRGVGATAREKEPLASGCLGHAIMLQAIQFTKAAEANEPSPATETSGGAPPTSVPLSHSVTLSFSFTFAYPPAPPLPPFPPLPPQPPPSPPSPPSPPTAPPPPPPDPPSPPPESQQLSHHLFSKLLHDETHLFRRMWGVEARHTIDQFQSACWSRKRDAAWVPINGEQFFAEAASGVHCAMNWYEGSGEAWGRFSSSRAPALLGFDDDIHRYCGGSCDNANVNILNLFTGSVLYNTCRNFEWQICAVKGLLPNQGCKAIKFARPPKTVNMDGWPKFGVCSGYTNAPCSKQSGFANDDIYFLEVCLFAMICSNHDQLFEVDADEEFVCKWDPEGFATLQSLLLSK